MTQSSLPRSIDETMLKISVLVVDELELDLAPEELDETANFVDDYGADSLGLIQVVARMDRELKIAVPQEETQNLVDLKAIRSFLESRS